MLLVGLVLMLSVMLTIPDAIAWIWVDENRASFPIQ